MKTFLRIFLVISVVSFFSLTIVQANEVSVPHSFAEGEKPVHFIDFPELPEIRWSIPETITFTVVDEADKPGATLRVCFDVDEGVTFPNLFFHIALNRQPRIGPSFEDRKPDENGILLLEGVPAPTPESDVIVLVSTRDNSPRYRPEKSDYIVKYGDEELHIRIIDERTLPREQRRSGAYFFSSGSRFGQITYSGDPPR